MNENKNLILAVVLSALVLLGWSVLSERFVPANPPPVKVEDGKVKPVEQSEAGPVAQTPATMRNRAVVLRETPRVQFQVLGAKRLPAQHLVPWGGDRRGAADCRGGFTAHAWRRARGRRLLSAESPPGLTGGARR